MMKIRCIYNTGQDLMSYDNRSLKNTEFGRFGASVNTMFNEITIGQEYLVMGIIIFETYQAYLIDDNGLISTCPCQLFEVIDNRINSNWYFRLIDKCENIYPFIQSVFGYYELCFDKKSYENLILENEEAAQRVYFKRKLELEKEYE